MKYYILSLMMLIVFVPKEILSQNDFPLEIDFRRNFDFNGVVSNDEIILCYGDFGMIYSSTDMGSTWERITLGDSNDIKQMTYYNDAFYAVSDYSLFKSLDNGKSWKYKSLNSTTFEFVVKGFDIFNNKIYLPLKNEIVAYDLDLNEISTDKIVVDESNQISGEAITFDNKIFVAKSVNYISIFNSSGNLLNFIDMNLVTPCNSNCIQRFYKEDDNLYLRYSNGLYKFNSVTLTFEPLRSNVRSALLFEEEDFYELSVRDGDLYWSDGPSVQKYIKNISFFKFDQSGNREILNLEQKQVPITEGFEFTSLNRITEDLLVGVGKRELIAISKDNGENWQIVSYKPQTLISRNSFEENDRVVLSERCVYLYDENFVTLRPVSEKREQYPRSFFSHSIMIRNDGVSLAFAPKPAANLNNHSLLLSNDFGNNFIEISRDSIRADLSSEKTIVDREGRFIITSNGEFQGWRYSFLYVLDNELNLVANHFLDSIHIISVNENSEGELVLALGKYMSPEQLPPPNELVYRNYSIEIHKINSLNFKIEKSGFPELHIDFEAFPFVTDRTTNDDEIIIQITGAFDFDNPTKPQALNFYKFKFSNNQIDSNFSNSTSNSPPLIKVNDYYYGQFVSLENFNVRDKIVYSNDFSLQADKLIPINLSDIFPRWLSGSSRDYNFKFDSQLRGIYTFNNKLQLTIDNFGVYIAGIDKTYQRNVVSLRPKTPSSVENSETETPRSRAFLHAGKPYPLPAVSTVSADLHWNAQYSAQEAVLKVFDSMGNEIPNANVELQQTNPYSGTVTWDCGAYPTGIYFIQVTIGTEQKNVGVAVVR